MSNFTLTVARDIDAPIATLFDVWADPDQVGQRFTPRPRIAVRRLDRPTRLTLTWTSSATGGDTLLTIYLAAVDRAHTQLRLTHDQFESAAARDDHRERWQRVLDGLAAAFHSRAGRAPLRD